MAWWKSKARVQLEDELADARRELAAINNSYTFSSLAEALSDIPTFAGPRVTAENATKASAVYACVQLIAGAIASLPLPIYQRNENGRARADHPVWWLLNEQPTQTMAAHTFWEWIVADRLLQRDGLAAIGRNAGGQVMELIPIRRQNAIIEKKDGRLRYYVQWDDGTTSGLDQDDVLHFPGFGFDGVQGKSVIELGAKQAVGLALASEEFSSKVFSNGPNASMVINVPGPLKSEQADNLREAWAKRYSGLANAHKPLVLSDNATATQLTMRAEDAALIESRQFQVIDIARWFGVPPFMIGETEKTSSWGSGIEAMSIGFVRYSLRRHLNLIEQEINRKLWPRREKYFAEFNVEGLLRGDSAAESKYFREALGGAQGAGWMTINEVRRIKNLPPEPDGDRVYRPAENGGGDEAARTPAEERE